MLVRLLAVTQVAACAALFVSTNAAAQSADSKAPTALGPGVNAGAVDSFAGARYVYFWAGPGAFSVKMSFQSMGLLGQPMRAALDFDFYDEQHKMVSHNAVVSVDKMEHAETSGTYDTRRRLVIAVIPPQTLVRTGGRFQLEASGAVAFDAAAPLRGPAGKLSGEEPLVHSTGPLVQHGGSLVQPAGPLVQSSGPLVHPVGPLVHAGGPLIEPLTVHETARQIHLVLAGDVLFDFDQASLRADAAAALQQVAAVVAAHARAHVFIEGYTDSKGSVEHNLVLSRNRAAAVGDWLHAVPALRATAFRIVALGAAHPIAPNALANGADNPGGRQRNRRVEVVIDK
jgi:outer membrane protein OmpA-like peptidoglycan-associated protein